VDNITSWHSLFPDDDLEDFLCEGSDAIDSLLDAQNSNTQLCYLPTLITDTKRDLGHDHIHGHGQIHESLGKRIFTDANQATSRGNAPAPVTGQVLQAVIDDTIPLLYIRRINHQNLGRDINLEGILTYFIS